jgi:hypothetical protein
MAFAEIGRVIVIAAGLSAGLCVACFAMAYLAEWALAPAFGARKDGER